MDPARRCELEQEKATLLIELEAVAASYAIWEQAFQKANVEQERIRKEEQDLIQRRDMLRMLVDAASDQVYRAEEDYRKLRVEGPLLAAAKVQDTEQVQNLKELVVENHHESIAMFQQMAAKFASAPWMQNLKRKEEQLIKAKRDIEKEQVERNELAADLVKYRNLVDDEIENPTSAGVSEITALDQRLTHLRIQKDEERRIALETQLFNSPSRRRSDPITPQKRNKQAEPLTRTTPNHAVRRIPLQMPMPPANRTPGSAKKSTLSPGDIIQPTPSPPPKRRSQQSQVSDTSMFVEEQNQGVVGDSLSPNKRVEFGSHDNSTIDLRSDVESMEIEESHCSPESDELQEETNESPEAQSNGDTVPDSDEANTFHFNLSNTSLSAAVPRVHSPVFAVPDLPQRFLIQNKKDKNPNANTSQNHNESVQIDLNASVGEGNSDFFNILENETGGACDDDDGTAAFSFLNSQSSNTQQSNDDGFNFNFDDDDNNDAPDSGENGFFF